MTKSRSTAKKPVTKQELDDALAKAIAPLATKAELAAAIAPLATKAELEVWIGALRSETHARFAQVDARFAQVDARFAQVDVRFDEAQRDLARHTQTILDAVQRMLTSFEEKYSDLPPRVRVLEEKVGLR